MKTFTLALSVVLIGGAANFAQGQADNWGSRTPSGYGVPSQGYGFGGPVAGHVHHSSTAAESFGRGKAAMLQAQGQFNLLTSLAVMNTVEAKRLQIENKRIQTENYLAKRKAYDEQRANYWAQRRTQQVNAPAISQTPRARPAKDRPENQVAANR